MSTLARPVFVTPRWRLGQWVAGAWQRLGWRHVLAAGLIEMVLVSIHPLGGIFFPPVMLPGWDPVVGLLSASWVLTNLAIVFGVLVADQAFDDGVPPVRAYGLAVGLSVLVLPSLDRFYFAVVLPGGVAMGVGRDEGLAQLVWWSLALLYECGFGVSIYAYWRVTQRAMRRAQAAETERARHEQRAQTAQLLALQSRVEPQLLFDTLGRIGALHARDPTAADALLADLISLLRSMQPGAGVDNSTVEREFGLVEAWLRVVRGAGHEGVEVGLRVSPESAALGIAPMLVLPLLRSVLMAPLAATMRWRLSADVVGHRLLIRLQAIDEGDHPEMSSRIDLQALQERLGRLFGALARLVVSSAPLSLTLDLPWLLEDPDDHRADR